MKPLNYKEIELILSEADLTGSKIQGVIQNSFHSLIWELYNHERGRFLFYTEIGTQESRLHIVSNPAGLGKTKKLQRFVQFARKNIEGSVIVNCTQLSYDRAVVWELNNHGTSLKLFIRLYSGPGANIIVTDSENRILDLLLRRPQRNEATGEILRIEERTMPDKEYTVREHSGSFNEFIENEGRQESRETGLSVLRAQVERKKEHDISRLLSSIASLNRTLQANKDYEELKYVADLLSSQSYLVKKGDESITVTDYGTNTTLTLTLDRKLSPGDNVSAFYDRYHRAKGAYENAVSEIKRLEEELKTTEEKYEKLLAPSEDENTDIRRLKAFIDKAQAPVQRDEAPGIRCTSGGFLIFAGRNAKENDELLRHYAKGSDMWFHTRDFPGGYVFVRGKKDKTIPLDVMLDAANLAVLFSKGKNSSSVDLYYTYVKYLRRAKNGKTGLVLPTQEKNLTVKPDRARIKRLLPDEV
ncbi:MAG: NFACT RNA binding domain-containing protein [Sphaerochaetaceae bacterium]|nr:NFACT RNA binding domain-containing protein [Sphaerochaetaceae bacterium]